MLVKSQRRVMTKIIPSPSMPTIQHSALDHSLVKWSSTRQWCYIHTLIFLSPREQPRERRKEENALFLLRLLLLLSPVSSMLCFSTHRFLVCWHNSVIHCIISLLRQKGRNSTQTIAPSMWDRERRGLLRPAHPISTGIVSILFLIERTSMKLL